MKNSFYDLCPELRNEWDYERNLTVDPRNIFRSYPDKVYWKGKCGHRWKSTINNRIFNGGKCPCCNGRYATDTNNLAVLYPMLLSEWDYKKNSVDPHNVLPKSHIKYCWKCKLGHEWLMMPAKRIRGDQCPYCSGRNIKNVCDSNCFGTNYPEIAKEWNYKKNYPLTPFDVVCGGIIKYWWICDKGHEWLALISNRIHKGHGCPYCSGHRVCKDNCLSTTHPELTKEWNYEKNYPLTPEDVTHGSEKKVHWKCKDGHEWLARILDRYRGIGCPRCSKIELKNGMLFDSLLEIRYYLWLVEQNIEFKYNQCYNDSTKLRYDFYLVKDNKYIELTSFSKKYDIYFQYLRKIVRKKKIAQQMNAGFEFIQRWLTRDEIQLVNKYIKRPGDMGR